MDIRQQGFVRQTFCLNALNSITNFINNSKNKYFFTILISLDISCAFDSVVWDKIKQQLYSKGCPEYLFKIINSYLSDRFVFLNMAILNLKNLFLKVVHKGQFWVLFSGI